MAVVKNSMKKKKNAVPKLIVRRKVTHEEVTEEIKEVQREDHCIFEDNIHEYDNNIREDSVPQRDDKTEQREDKEVIDDRYSPFGIISDSDEPENDDLISKFHKDPKSLDEAEFTSLFGGLSEFCDESEEPENDDLISRFHKDPKSLDEDEFTSLFGEISELNAETNEMEKINQEENISKKGTQRTHFGSRLSELMKKFVKEAVSENKAEESNSAKESAVSVPSVPEDYTYEYYNRSRRQQKTPYSEQTVLANVIDKKRKKVIRIQDTAFRPTEIVFSCQSSDTQLIEKREDGFWYLNGAVATHFDVYLNGVQKKGSYYYRLNEGDTFMLCGVSGKGKTEYHGEDFEYQFFAGEIE